MDCMFITQRDWKKLDGEFPDVFRHIKRRALQKYVTVIQPAMEKFKQIDIKKFDERSDYKQVMVLTNYDPDEMKKIVE